MAIEDFRHAKAVVAASRPGLRIVVVAASKRQRMDAVVLIACLALVGTLLIVLLLLCRLVQPYDIAWFLSSREDKLKLSKMRLYNANGYLMHSGSEILLGSTGSFQRFDSVDRDYKPPYGHHAHQQGTNLTVPPWRTSSTEESEIPPQPLRPAPSPREPKLTREKAIQKQTSEPKPSAGSIIISPIPRPVPRKQHSAPISFPLPVLNSPRDAKRFHQEPHICTNPFLNEPPLKEEVDPVPPQPPEVVVPVVPEPSVPAPEPFLQRLIRSANNPFASDPRKPDDECIFSFEPATVQSVFAEEDPSKRAERRLSKMENLRKMSRLIESNQMLLNIYQQFNGTVDRSSESDQRSPPVKPASSSSSTSPIVSPKLIDITSTPTPTPSTSRTDNSKYQDSPRTEAGDNINLPTVSKGIKHILRNRSFSETEFSERKLFKGFALATDGDQTPRIPLMKNSSYKDLTRYYNSGGGGSGMVTPSAVTSGYSSGSSTVLQKTVSESFLEQYTLGREHDPGGSMASGSSSGSVAAAFNGSGGSVGGLRSVIPSTSTESVASQSSVIFSDLEPAQPITGYLCVGLQYDKSSTTIEGVELLVTIQEAKQLVCPPGIEMDTFVKVFIVPDESKVLQTKVFKNSCYPSYQETFSFWITHKSVRRSLWFHVYHTSSSEQTLIGECEMQLNENISRPMTTWLKLMDSSHKKSPLGELMFSLSYLPTAERLTVVIVKARNLNLKSSRAATASGGRSKQLQQQVAIDDEAAVVEQEDDGGEVDSSEGIFVKVYLLKNDKKVSKKKTCVKRGERSPIYNEAIIFSVPPYMLNTIQIRCSVVQMTNRTESNAINNNNNNSGGDLIQFGYSSYDSSGNNLSRKQSTKLVSIGHVIVGSGTTGKGLRHWHQMLTTLRKPVTMWHVLKITSERKRKRLGELEQASG
uniref:Synaptotagmin-12 n=1 Tax=Culex pipiens TaxID=7175 RepID=A0A8D8CVC2_CULPI